MDNSIYGQQSTLSATNEALHINIEDQIVKYPDLSFPILKRWNSKVFKAAVKSHKYEWTEREARPTKAKVASATVGANDTSFYVDRSGVFNVDDVLQKPHGEVVIVTAVSGGTLLTVTPWTGTPEAMSLGDTVIRLGVASPQGKDADDMVIQGTQDLFNYTQIFEDVVHLTGTQREALIHGDETQADLIERKHKELLEVMQNSFILGKRNLDVATKRYTLGGLKYFIDTYAPENAIDFGGSWASDATVIDKFEDAVEKIALNGGSKPTIYMGYKAMRKLRKVQYDILQGSKTDKSRGIGVVDTYLSQLGELDIVQIVDRSNLFDDIIIFVDESKVGYKAMRNRAWFTEELAKVGDSYKWQVLGEYTVKVETPKVLSYMYNLGL